MADTILPFSLGAVLLASRNKKIVGEEYHHPTWLIVLGVCTHLGCVPLNNAGDYNAW